MKTKWIPISEAAELIGLEGRNYMCKRKFIASGGWEKKGIKIEKRPYFWFANLADVQKYARKYGK